MENNALAFEVGIYFRLNKNQMLKILSQVLKSVENWKNLAKKIGITRSEQELMQNAFKLVKI